MLKIVKGNLLDATEPFIVHQTNCLGIMGGGVALQIRNKYPHVYDEYKRVCERAIEDRVSLLGKIQIIPIDLKDVHGEGQCVVNLFGQAEISRRENATDYLAVERCFQTLNSMGKDIAIPYYIGCGLAGGDWNIVKKIIENECKDITVVAYDIDGLSEEIEKEKSA